MFFLSIFQNKHYKYSFNFSYNKTFHSVQVKSYIFVFLVIFLFGCSEDEQRRIPESPVYIELNLMGEYSTFRNAYDTVVFDKRKLEIERIGYGGILVNIDYEGKYHAYDLCCPNEVDRNIRIFPNSTGTQAECRICGSVFEIWNGTGMVSKGPSKWNLKRYRADKINEVVYISR